MITFSFAFKFIIAMNNYEQLWKETLSFLHISPPFLQMGRLSSRNRVFWGLKIWNALQSSNWVISLFSSFDISSSQFLFLLLCELVDCVVAVWEVGGLDMGTPPGPWGNDYLHTAGGGSNILLLIVVLFCFVLVIVLVTMLVFWEWLFTHSCSNILLLIVVLGPVFDTANDDADCFADANYHNWKLWERIELGKWTL